jgi:bacillithiol biosynthesis cysteine-adding enzyme BshC
MQEMPSRTPTQNFIPYDRFPDPPSTLFRDYLAENGAASAFFSGPPVAVSVAQTARTASTHPRDRHAVAQALAARAPLLGATSAASAERLADARSVAVVTGQQAGLFGGPLFVLYKALGAILIAHHVETDLGLPAVPVFWIAADDHDFAEIRHCPVSDTRGTVHELRYNPHEEPRGLPASQIVLDESIGSLIDELAHVLEGAGERDFVVDRVRDAYRPGRPLSVAFARLIAALLPDLVLLDAADPALKALATPLLRREILDGSPSTRLALATGERLLAAGYHQQVLIRPGFLNLFLLADGERRALAIEGDTIAIRGTQQRMRPQELASLLDASPELFSPGAPLRPLVQDALLPTAAYVAGPAEIAYHAQIGDAYGHFGVPRPTLLPRPGVTLIEPAQMRALEAEHLDVARLQGEADRILAEWTRETHPEVDEAFAHARAAVRECMRRVEASLAALDPTLQAAANSAAGRALFPIDNLQEKALRVLKKRDQVRADRLRRTHEALFPGGSFQERGLGLVSMLARHGPRLIDELSARIDPWARAHQIIPL